MYSEHYITRAHDMCAFLVMGRSLHPRPSEVKPDYGLSLRERYSPHFKLDGAARCFPIPTACMWPMMTAFSPLTMLGPMMPRRIRTVLALSRSLFLPTLFAFSYRATRTNLFSPRRMSPGSWFAHPMVFKSAH